MSCLRPGVKGPTWMENMRARMYPIPNTAEAPMAIRMAMGALLSAPLVSSDLETQMPFIEWTTWLFHIPTSLIPEPSGLLKP